MNKIVPILILITFITSCKKEDKDAVIARKVTYQIGCTDCMVVYSDENNQQQTIYDQNTSSFSYTFEGKKGQEVLLLAYNTGDQPQGVTATILLNDTVFKTRTTYCPISGVSMVVDTLRD